MNTGRIGKKVWLGIMIVLVLGLTVLSACSSSGAEPTPAPSQHEVTLADEGKTITLKAGDSFLLKLGEAYDWSVTLSDNTIVSRVVGITVVRGAQGVYEAHTQGNATLTATGDPVCRQSRPACEMPTRIFEVQLRVTS